MLSHSVFNLRISKDFPPFLRSAIPSFRVSGVFSSVSQFRHSGF